MELQIQAFCTEIKKIEDFCFCEWHGVVDVGFCALKKKVSRGFLCCE